MMLSKLISAFGIPSFIILPLLSLGQPSSLYTDVAAESGLDFKYSFGDYTYGNILESSGSGITIIDYDGDGDMDLYMLSGTYLEGVSDPDGKVFKGASNKLYRNEGNGLFTEVSELAGVDDKHWSMAASAIDYDHDGDVDMFLSNYGPNVFYQNNGNGTFTDITEQLGLQGPQKLNGHIKWSVSAAFWDYNEDGSTDLIVGNFLAFDPEYISATYPDMMPHPSEYKGQASIMYKQEEDGTFTDVTSELGLYFPDSKCMGLTVFDYDEDGDMDLFQGNDHQLNFLFRNDENQVFEEVGVATGIAVNDQGDPTGSMHGTLGDVDGDGKIDLLVTDLKYGALYRNLGNGIFEDITRRSGIAAAFEGKGQWAAALFDYDNDGDLDVFTANGTAEELIEQPPLLLENDGYGHFKNIGESLGDYFKGKRSGRGAAVTDYDNDGDLDIVVSHVDLTASASLLRNNSKNGNHWLGISLIGQNGATSAIGAKVVVTTRKSQQSSVNQWSTSYLSSNDPRMHFGLGDESIITSLEILWPSGEKETFENIVGDRYIIIKQGVGIE